MTFASLVMKVLSIIPLVILLDVIIESICSLNVKLLLVTTPKSLTMVLLAISSFDGFLYGSIGSLFRIP